MKTFRKILFWCHLSAGVVAGLIVLLMSVTGVLLTYEKQMTNGADKSAYNVAPATPNAAPLAPEALTDTASSESVIHATREIRKTPTPAGQLSAPPMLLTPA